MGLAAAGLAAAGLAAAGLAAAGLAAAGLAAAGLVWAFFCCGDADSSWLKTIEQSRNFFLLRSIICPGSEPDSSSDILPLKT
jgi:hypothetical protein